MRNKEKELWNWLHRQGPKTIFTLFERAELDREKFFSEAAQLRHQIEKGGRRKLAVPLEQLDEIHEMRMDRMKKKHRAKKSPKAAKIERQYYAIRQFREKGHSWDDIIAYLGRYHQLNVSRGYFMSVWKELEEKYKSV